MEQEGKIIKRHDLWGFSQHKEAESYIKHAQIAFEQLDFSGVNSCCIFNCSDGPSSLGIIRGVRATAPDTQFIIADICPSAVGDCFQFVKSREASLPVAPLVSETESIITSLSHFPSLPQAFASFEPIGNLPDAFKKIIASLPPKGILAVCSRGYLGMGVQALRTAGSEQNIGEIKLHQPTPPVRTIKGPLLTLVLTKKGD